MLSLLAWLLPLALAEDPPVEPGAPAPDAAPSAEEAPSPEEAPAPLIWEAAELPELPPIVYKPVVGPDGAEIPIDELPLTEMPAAVSLVQAAYPPEAEAAGLQGVVTLLVELDEHGRLTYAEVIRPAGNGFDEAALAAVAASTFSPAQTEAGPVGAAFEFNYGFTLAPPEPEPEAPPPPAPVNVEGNLREMGTRLWVADVQVVVDGTELVTRTDAEGRFELRGVPVGTHTLRVLSPEHAPLEQAIEVAEGELTSASLWIRSLQYRDNEAVGVYQREKTEVTRRTLAIEEVKRVPGTFGDPVKVVQTLPGAARSPFGTGLLIIRGSNPEDSGVYVDGIRIPIIYHLTGTTSVLTPDLIESVDYLPGGFGAQYGRSMAGVVDIKTKSEFAENGKLVWGTDILDSQIYYEGKVGKNKQHGVAVGARRSYIDVFIPLFVSGGFAIQPKYWDYSLKWVPEMDGDRKLSAFVYGFEDVLGVSSPDGFAQGSDRDTQGAFRLKYSTHRAILRYEQPLGEHLRLTVTPGAGLDYNLTDAFGTIKLDSYNGVFNTRAEMAWTPTPKVEVVPGVDIFGGPWSFKAAFPFTFEEAVDPLAERNPITLYGRGWFISPDTYVKALLRPLEDPDAMLINLGLRYSSVAMVTKGSVAGAEPSRWTQGGWDPRFAARVRLFEGGTLKTASGVFTQPPQPFEAIGLGTDSQVRFESAWNSSIGFEHQIKPAVSWDVDFFYRDMNNLIVTAPNFDGAGDQTFVNAGDGRAYGGELILRHAPANRFFGWVSYTLSRSERRDGPDDDWYVFDFDQTHIFSAQAGYDLPKDWGVSGQVQYVTGNPTSPYDAGVYDVDTNTYAGFRAGPYNGERLPPFFQTSLRVDRLFTFRNWQLATYLDLLNAVKGVNPEFTQYSYDYSEYAYVRGLPFIPNIGFEAKYRP